eukprot:746554-Hanusia_phi.AAC.2
MILADRAVKEEKLTSLLPPARGDKVKERPYCLHMSDTLLSLRLPAHPRCPAPRAAGRAGDSNRWAESDQLGGCRTTLRKSDAGGDREIQEEAYKHCHKLSFRFASLSGPDRRIRASPANTSGRLSETIWKKSAARFDGLVRGRSI